MNVTLPKEFQDSLEKLDLSSTLMLLSILSQRALFLQQTPKKKSSILQIKDA